MLLTEEIKKQWIEENKGFWDTSNLKPCTDEEAERLIAKNDKIGMMCGGEAFDEFTHNEVKKVLQGKSTWAECNEAVFKHIDEKYPDEDPDVSDEELNNFSIMHHERTFDLSPDTAKPDTAK